MKDLLHSYKKAYWIKLNDYNLIVGLSGNLTKTRKLAIARQLLDFLDFHNLPYQKVSNLDYQLELALSELNKIGFICDNLTIKEYDFYHSDGTTKRYLDITCPYSSSIANNPLKTTSLLIG